jgi:hypothetical protein
MLPWLPLRCCLCQCCAATNNLPLPPATALPTVLLPPLTQRCRQAAAAATANMLPPLRRCSATATALLPSITFVFVAVVAVSVAVAAAALG